MRTVKERLTVTVDPHLVEAGQEAVSTGRIESLSAWVNLALAERAAKERRLRALSDAVASYEAEFGLITPEELAVQDRADRRMARVAPDTTPRASRHRRRRVKA
jgi:Arc/MetJ-type ribon-helix-helix transcriptional regulator